MKNIFTVLFVLFLFSARANNYYFSSLTGDDSRTPAQAGDASAPWKTLSKLNSFFSNLKPGDSVLLKRGETFYGFITVNKSGTRNLPIVISAYGSGNRPVITSLVTLGVWVSKGNGIWETSEPLLGATANNVLINNVAQQIGRYPNSDVANKGFLTLESHTSNSVTDNELTAAPNWTGAEIVLRLRRWVIDRCPITNHSGSTLTYTAASSYVANDNYGYFIQNDIKTLDKFGEWYYNSSLKKLSVYFGANAPSSYVVQASSIENLINSSSYSYIVFDNLTVKGANTDGFSIRNGNGINIKNCDVLFSGVNGFTVRFHDYLRIENCTISNSNNNGIDLGYSGDEAVIRNNKIINTSMVTGMGGSGDNKGFGIFSNGYGSVIEYNEIINTGYIGINFNGDSTIVKNNYIDTYCTTKDDGAGIYTYTGPANTTKYGRKIIGNIIVNGIGSPEGINDDAAAAEGIYLDDNSSGVEISDNTISNMPDRGLYLNNARNLLINNNTFYNTNVQFYAHQYRKVAGAAIRNLIVKQNIFFSKDIDQTTAYFITDQDDNNLIGTFDNNYYARPIDDGLTIFNSYVDSSGSRVNENLDLEGWKKKYDKDASSKRSAKQIASYRLNSITSANKVANGNFTSNAGGVLLTSCTIAWGNAGQLDGGYLEVTPSAKKSAVYMKIGGLTAGKKYLIKYSARSSGIGNMTVGTFLRKDGYPYNNFTAIQSRKLSTVRTDNEMLFVSSATETAANVFFNVDNQMKYYLDNIQVYEADASITNIDDSLRFEYNGTQVSKTVSLEGNYVDVKNNKYSESVVLKPFTSVVLIKDGGAAVANVAPSVSIISPDKDATFAAPASVTINATAADSDGTISKVEFYNGNTLLGTVTDSPYVFTWNNVPAGDYSITAKATDNGSIVTTSAAVTVSVDAPNVAPSVTIVSPADKAIFSAPASVTINVTAADTDGTISKVEFYNGNTLLGTDIASPYIFTWNNVPAGNYSITAKATDNGSLVTTSAAATITVLQNIPPVVTITSPAASKKYTAPATIFLSASATDEDGTIRKVQFYNGTTLLQTENYAPYTYSWTNVAAGTYTITATATDDEGAVTTSAGVTVSVAAKTSALRPAAAHNTADKTNGKYIYNLLSEDKDDQKMKGLRIFPNPAVGTIQISTEGVQPSDKKAFLNIKSMSGIMLKSIPVIVSGKTIAADVSFLRPGIYTISLVSDDFVISRKFIKN